MLYPIKRNNKYGFVNDLGEIILEPQFEYVGKFSNGVCSVLNSISEIFMIYNDVPYHFGEVSFIDVKGEIVFPFKRYLRQDIHFSEELAFCYNMKLQKWGVIDKKGEEVLPFIFDDAKYSRFSGGLAKIKKEGKFGFINSNNEVVIPFSYDSADVFSEDFCLVKNKARSFLIDKTGKELKISKFKIHSSFVNGLAKVSLNKKFGFIDMNLNLKIECVYDGICGDFEEGFCGVKKGDKYALIDEAGDNITEFIFDGMSAFRCGLCPVKIGKKWTLINDSGKIIFEPKFDYINDFGEYGYDIDYPKVNLTRAFYQKREVYINKIGEIICEYESIEKKFQEIDLIEILNKKPDRKEIWDKAEWSYDGFSITKKGAIKPFYFILKWFNKKGLLTEEGISCFKDKNNLEIGLYRFMFKPEAAVFLDYFYDYWYEKQHIANYQIDSSLSFEEDENLEKYWQFYTENKKA